MGMTVFSNTETGAFYCSDFRTFDVTPPEGIEVTAIYGYIKWVVDEDDQFVSEFPKMLFDGKTAFDMRFASSEYECILVAFNGDDPVGFYRANALALENLDRINLRPWIN